MANGKQPGLEEQLTPEIYGALWRFCRRLCAGRNEDAQDLLQDTLARGLLAFHKLREPAALKSWLFAIARRRFLDLRRSAAWRERDAAARRESAAVNTSDRSDVAGAAVDIRGQPLAAMAGGPRSAGDGFGDSYGPALAEALARLPDALREVLELHYFEGLSLEECARVLACSPAAAKQRLYRGREALRSALEARGDR